MAEITCTLEQLWEVGADLVDYRVETFRTVDGYFRTGPSMHKLRDYPQLMWGIGKMECILTPWVEQGEVQVEVRLRGGPSVHYLRMSRPDWDRLRTWEWTAPRSPASRPRTSPAASRARRTASPSPRG